MKNLVKKNDTVVLIETTMKKYLIDTKKPIQRFRGIGVFDPKILIGKPYGEKLEIGNKQFWILSPSLQDKLTCIRRHAQIILPRDAAHIVINCAIESGDHVLEAGIGSGSLTIALANAVLPTGKVYSYDIREDFIEYALQNLTSTGLADSVSIKKQDITKKISEKELDAIILDIPTPWMAVGHAWKALKTGGYFCSYSPLISQVEHTVEQLWNHPFIEIKTLENIQREMIVSRQGTRPSFEMLGHTGYLTFARKILKP